MNSINEVTEKPWMGKEIFIGIDVHKKQWNVTILTDRMEHKTFSQDPDPNILGNYLSRNFPGANYHSVYEAGFSGFWASQQLRELGVDNIIVNAADVPTNHKERENKTDKADSRKLALSLRAGQLRGIREPDNYQLSVRQFIRRRKQLLKDLTREKNRLKSFFFLLNVRIPECFSSSASKYFSKKYIQWVESLSFEDSGNRFTVDSYLERILGLRAQLLEANRKIREFANDPYWKQDVDLLVSIPGIGVLSALTLLTELPPVTNFVSNDHMNSYIGLVPKVHASGQREYHGRLTTRGKNRVKETIIESSWALVRSDPAMLLCFQQLCSRMEKNKAIIRIARKLINRIRRVLLNKEPYQLNIY